MNTSQPKNTNAETQKDFWDNLQSEILFSKQMLSHDDFYGLVEKVFMFSLFYRGLSCMELNSFKSIFHLKDTGYLILLQLTPEDRPRFYDFNIDEPSLCSFIKEILGDKRNYTVGPLISNRISILITEDFDHNPEVLKNESLAITNRLAASISAKYDLSVIGGVGNPHGLSYIYTSFIEALSCMPLCKPGQIIHKLDAAMENQDIHYDYDEAEKHMLDAIRMRKTEAYDYFVLLMNYIRKMNNEARKNRILEILVLASHAVKSNGMNATTDYFNFSEYVKAIGELKDDQLLEWAYQSFIHITGYVKPQNFIDYSNKIVQATKEYLEAHYTEDISLEDVAEQVNISPQYFSKLIKKNTGFNFIDWLSMLRVKKAKELLSNSDLSVKEVCFMVGYKDPNYFSRIFKKRLGITPSDFVKNRNYLNNKS